MNLSQCKFLNFDPKTKHTNLFKPASDIYLDHTLSQPTRWQRWQANCVATMTVQYQTAQKRQKKIFYLKWKQRANTGL